MASTAKDLPAGDFSAWLRHARSALSTGAGTEVECGACTACCDSSYFIHIGPEETEALDRIEKGLLAAAPGLPEGHVVMGYDKNGVCPMLIDGRCSIYAHRPQTCRAYDCRVLAAAGITAGGGDKTRITQRAKRWKFSYPTGRDRDENAAVQAAARFIREHAECFPGGEIPSDPNQLAILAIKACEVFLAGDEGPAKNGHAASDAEVADAIVEACRQFDAALPA
jgi:hypothetical protein